MSETPNLRAIQVDFMPPTDRKGSRVRLRCLHWPDMRQTVILSVDHTFRDCYTQADAYLRELGFHVQAHSVHCEYRNGQRTEKCMYILVSDFNRSVRDGGAVIA
jgi:hypothetical protein